MADWTDQIVGARMTVDQQFADRVTASQFSRQQWGLIMTAVEFEIENADDADTARIVANTSKLKHVMSELDQVDAQMQAMGAGGSGKPKGGGFLSGIKDVLGLGGSGGNSREQKEAAERLANEYANELQRYLESEGRWQSVRRSVADEA